eukprot:TRINITY_DN95183_c0_g1_i1.p1 TRINITY_DN95183_c0_g1~~TRINITY_DN95183_c0_g1_i1.p1  ORF type:complete len:395 (+),score=94.62 TRINITY_DN95183_c0_g1_i1:79-1185(+)
MALCLKRTYSDSIASVSTDEGSDLSDTCCSDSSSPWEAVCETPVKTNNKRRRLRLVSSNSSPIAKKVQKESQTPSWTLSFASNTPSRADGVSEKLERSYRMFVCARVRDILRGVLRHGEDSANMQLFRLKVQALGCYYVQQLFMSASFEAEDCEIVALATAMSAIRAMNSPCDVYTILKAFNEQQRAAGEAEITTEDYLGSPVEQILEMAQRIDQLGQCKQFRSLGSARPDLPLDSIDKFVEKIIERLPESKAFTGLCRRGRPASDAARRLEPELKKQAHILSVDAMMGPAAVFVKPESIARAVAAVASSKLLKQLGAEVTGVELMGFVMEMEAKGTSVQTEAPSKEEVRSALSEVFATFALWEEQCA